MAKRSKAASTVPGVVKISGDGIIAVEGKIEHHEDGIHVTSKVPRSSKSRTMIYPWSNVILAGDQTAYVVASIEETVSVTNFKPQSGDDGGWPTVQGMSGEEMVLNLEVAGAYVSLESDTFSAGRDDSVSGAASKKRGSRKRQQEEEPEEPEDEDELDDLDDEGLDEDPEEGDEDVLDEDVLEDDEGLDEGELEGEEGDEELDELDDLDDLEDLDGDLDDELEDEPEEEPEPPKRRRTGKKATAKKAASKKASARRRSRADDEDGGGKTRTTRKKAPARRRFS